MAATKKTASKTTDKKDGQLVRSTRQNPMYDLVTPEGNRYRFTLDDPFVVVAEEDVDYVVSQWGIELATPAQAESFYDSNN